MKLQCGHLFCFGCLSEYLKTNDGKKCPVCRAPVTGERPEPGPPPPQGIDIYIPNMPSRISILCSLYC